MKNKNYILVGIGIALSLFSSHAAHAKPNYITVINQNIQANIEIEIDRMAFQNPECWHESQKKEMNGPPSSSKIILQGNSFDKNGTACQFNVYANISASQKAHYSEAYDGPVSCPPSKPGDTLVISKQPQQKKCFSQGLEVDKSQYCSDTISCSKK